MGACVSKNDGRSAAKYNEMPAESEKGAKQSSIVRRPVYCRVTHQRL